MLSISPYTVDLYREEGSNNHQRMVNEGLTYKDVEGAMEKFEDLVNSFVTQMKEAGFTQYTDCGQVYFENDKFHFMLTDYIQCKMKNR